MIEICLVVIALCSIVGAIANVKMTRDYHTTFTQQLSQMGEDVRFQRRQAEKAYDDALRWKIAAQINAEKANNSAFNFLKDQLKELRGAGTLSDEKNEFIDFLVRAMENWEKGDILLGNDEIANNIKAIEDNGNE